MARREDRTSVAQAAPLGRRHKKGPAGSLPPGLFVVHSRRGGSAGLGWLRSPCRRPCRPCRACRRRAAASSSGFSAMAASVVISRPATEAASCSAMRTTLVGSMTPASPCRHSVGLRIEAQSSGLSRGACRQRPSRHAGIFGDLADRRLQGTAHDVDAARLVVIVALRAVERLRQRRAARYRRPERCLPRRRRGLR